MGVTAIELFMKAKPLFFIAILVLTAVSVWYFDATRFLDLDYFASRRAELLDYVAQYPYQAVCSFIAIYILTATLSLPGGAVLTLIAGALFGVVWGSLYVSFASTIGASFAFLLSRFFFRESIQRRFGHRLTRINEGMEKEGALYLFGMRFVPLIPYFVVNLLMGLTTIKLWKFYLASQIGMLPATVIFVNAGTQISKIESISDVLSPQLMASFIILALFPLATKKIMRFVRGYKVTPSEV
ncbi:MAG: putative membrane protein YdjX (TVP38/TMEM64 family) [Flavobacteriales bacterium]